MTEITNAGSQRSDDPRMPNDPDGLGRCAFVDTVARRIELATLADPRTLTADVEHDTELLWDSAERRELDVEGIKAGPDQTAAAAAAESYDCRVGGVNHNCTMTTPSGARGELVDLLVDAISSLPDDEWTDAATYAAFALGGPPLEFSAAPENQIPNAGTIGAEWFIAGRTMGRKQYFALLRSRLVEVIKDGLREDFIVTAVADDISAQLERLTDTEAANEGRAKTADALKRQLEDPTTFRLTAAAQDPSFAELSDDEFTQHLTRMLDRLKPVDDAELSEHVTLKNHWETARQQHLAAEIVEAWRTRSLFDV